MCKGPGRPFPTRLELETGSPAQTSRFPNCSELKPRLFLAQAAVSKSCRVVSWQPGHKHLLFQARVESVNQASVPELPVSRFNRCGNGNLRQKRRRIQLRPVWKMRSSSPARPFPTRLELGTGNTGTDTSFSNPARLETQAILAKAAASNVLRNRNRQLVHGRFVFRFVLGVQRHFQITLLQKMMMWKQAARP
jgi:hypothetical protein